MPAEIKDGLDWSFYLDGALLRSYTFDSTDGGNLLLFQSSTLDSWGWCRGTKLDEVGVYGRALELDEVLELYGQGAGRFFPEGFAPP